MRGKTRSLSQEVTEYLIKIVTTQMCQCGLANLDRGSHASRYFVSGQNMEQTTVYSLSKDDKSLKLTLSCHKTNFTDYFVDSGDGNVSVARKRAGSGSSGNITLVDLSIVCGHLDVCAPVAKIFVVQHEKFSETCSKTENCHLRKVARPAARSTTRCIAQ